MGSFDVKFPDNFMANLLNTNAEEICTEALKEAAPILTENMKRSARMSIMHEGESEAVNSIAQSEAKRTKDGSAFIINVGPRGYSQKSYRDKKNRKYKVSNALKLIWKEYGVAGRQAPRPFLVNATRNAYEKVMNKLQEVYNRKAGGTG